MRLTYNKPFQCLSSTFPAYFALIFWSCGRPISLSHPAVTSQLSADWKAMWSAPECFEDSEGTACIRPPGGQLITHGRSSGPALDEQRGGGGGTSDQ